VRRAVLVGCDGRIDDMRTALALTVFAAALAARSAHAECVSDCSNAYEQATAECQSQYSASDQEVQLQDCLDDAQQQLADCSDACESQD
jgi:uncharacterized lipoprotein NlpE involved in copper resistance